jgi:1-acyl-sn-glycerol-3-phosphate acyltransferase
MRSLDYFYDNPSSGEGHFSQKFCVFFCAAARVVFTLLFRYKAYGQKILQGLPEGTGFIIAANHRSFLDPVFVMCVLRPRPVRYIAKEEFIGVHPFIARLAAWVGVFPVKRKSADMSAIKRSVRMLKRGEIVGVFPEGTRVRSKDQEVTYYEGIALMSQLAKVPVVPVRLWGADRIRPKGMTLFRLPKVTLCFGEPLSLSEERFVTLPKDERFTAFTHEVMGRVYGMELPRG